MDGEAILVGHSVGAHVLLKYLSEEEVEKPVAGLFLVAAPYAGTGGWELEEDALPEDFASKLPRVLTKFLYHGRDDEVAPFGHLALYEANLPRANLPRVRRPRAPVRRRSVRSRQGHPAERAMATGRQFLAGTGDAPCRFSSVYGSQGLRLGLFRSPHSSDRRVSRAPVGGAERQRILGSHPSTEVAASEPDQPDDREHRGHTDQPNQGLCGHIATRELRDVGKRRDVQQPLV